MAEQLLNFNDISENAILRADMRKACEDIGTAILTNSGIFVPALLNVVQYIAILWNYIVQ